jgi:hypothetical protein
LAGNDGNPLRRHAGEQCLRGERLGAVTFIPGSLARCARHGFRSRGIGPPDPMPTIGHTEDEDSRRGNLRDRTCTGDCAKPALRRKKVQRYDKPAHAHFPTFGRSNAHCLPTCPPIRCGPDWGAQSLGKSRHAGKRWHTSSAPTTRGAGAAENTRCQVPTRGPNDCRNRQAYSRRDVWNAAARKRTARQPRKRRP